MTDYEVLDLIVRYSGEDAEGDRKLLSKAEDINDNQLYYLLQFGHKTYWEAEANILASLGYPKVRPVFYDLFGWLKDYNWPGAVCIWDNILMKVEKHVFVDGISVALQRALLEFDWQWIYWLVSLARHYGVSANDFQSEDSAYDIILYYQSSNDEDDIPINEELDLLLDWGYPRIRQFIPHLLSSLSLLPPEGSEQAEQYHMIFAKIPIKERTIELRKALNQLTITGNIKSLKWLETLIPISAEEKELIQMTRNPFL